MDNFTSRYTAKDAERYGADIFKGLQKLNERKKSQLNPVFEEEVKILLDRIYENRKNLTMNDLRTLEFLTNKLYTE